MLAQRWTGAANSVTPNGERRVTPAAFRLLAHAGISLRIGNHRASKGDGMMRFRVLVVALTMGVAGWAAPTQAAVITYTMSSLASGTLGGTPFTDALVTVELTADTSGVVEPAPSDGGAPGVLFNEGTATLTIAGLGTATFNDPFGYFAVFFPASVFPGCPCVGIFEGGSGGGTAILGLVDASLAGYDLASAFGPLTGTGAGLAMHPDGSPVEFLTTAGALFLTSGGDRATLTVTVEAVPEPASLSLFAVAAFGAIAARRRRPRQDP
jgi:hypothetical protein